MIVKSRRARRRYPIEEDMMTVARAIILLLVLAGGLSVSACVPPTPKAGPQTVIHIAEARR
jgi:hypothetical protein